MSLDLDKNVLILIPSFRPTEELIEYIDELIQNNYKSIVVVNDGSPTKYNEIFDNIKLKKECIVLKNEINMGKGFALRKGFEYFKEINKKNDYVGIVTVDSDGQHLVKDIYKIIEGINKYPNSLILGSRNFSKNSVPIKSKFGNKVTSITFKLFYRAKISDTQTGLRGIPLSLVDNFINIKGNRFEYETNMLIYCILNKIKIIEKTIETVYIDKNISTSFKPIHDSVIIYSTIFKAFIEYLAFSVIQFFENCSPKKYKRKGVKQKNIY